MPAFLGGYEMPALTPDRGTSPRPDLTDERILREQRSLARIRRKYACIIPFCYLPAPEWNVNRQQEMDNVREQYKPGGYFSWLQEKAEREIQAMAEGLELPDSPGSMMDGEYEDWVQRYRERRDYTEHGDALAEVHWGRDEAEDPEVFAKRDLAVAWP